MCNAGQHVYSAVAGLWAALGVMLADKDVALDVVVVDNGCPSGAIDRVKALPGVRVITPESNTGFSGGAVRGAAEAAGDYLAFVNSDAIVAPGALARLAEVAGEPKLALPMPSITLPDTPDLINTARNPLHFVALSWAGCLREPAPEHA